MGFKISTFGQNALATQTNLDNNFTQPRADMLGRQIEPQYPDLPVVYIISRFRISLCKTVNLVNLQA